MKQIHVNIFLLHRKSNAIILESFFVPLTDYRFFKFAQYSRDLLLGDSELDLLDFLYTYCTYTKVLQKIAIPFFKLHLKKLFFPFWFKIRIDCIDNSLYHKFLAKCYEIYLNLKLYF